MIRIDIFGNKKGSRKERRERKEGPPFCDFRQLCDLCGLCETDFNKMGIAYFRKSLIYPQGMIHIEIIDDKIRIQDAYIIPDKVCYPIFQSGLKLLDKLCGSWKDDGSLEAIFAEIESQRHEDKPREAIQPEARENLERLKELPLSAGAMFIPFFFIP